VTPFSAMNSTPEILTVILEEKMSGQEASVFVLTDGKEYKILPVAQDHKAVGEGDTGPNTGGMGAYAPAPVMTPELLDRVKKQIIDPTLSAMEREGCRYRGVLYVGLMLTEQGPKVVEYNCRFGDPETQAVLPLVQTDWYELFISCARGGVAAVEMKTTEKAAATVVLCSGGYPGAYEKGIEISGLDSLQGVTALFAGVSRNEQGAYVTSGGRVINVVCVADTLSEALKTIYAQIDAIEFNGKFYRSDIGHRALSDG